MMAECASFWMSFSWTQFTDTHLKSVMIGSNSGLFMTDNLGRKCESNYHCTAITFASLSGAGFFLSFVTLLIVPDCENKWLCTQCEPTGLGSPGCHVHLVTVQHPCEEARGQLREKIRTDLMMVRGGCVHRHWKVWSEHLWRTEAFSAETFK